jgi:molybdopterin-guanine dinucleotide biosynthesis protein MobB
MERLVREFVSRGLRVATIKHDAHDFEIDIPGKDTWRHREAGSKMTIIASASKLALVHETEREAHLSDLLQFVDESFDLVLVEGMRSSPLPKILVRRSEAGEDPPGIRGTVIAVVSGDLAAAPRNLLFQPDETAALADLIQHRMPANKEAVRA